MAGVVKKNYCVVKKNYLGIEWNFSKLFALFQAAIGMSSSVFKTGSHGPVLGTTFYSNSEKLFTRINICMN